MTSSTTKTKSARDVIQQIWYRARINAFAHKEAMLEYSEIETSYFRWIIITSLLSVLSIIIVYMISTSDHDATDHGTSTNSKLIIGFTFSSIIFSVLSLFFAIMSNHKRCGIRAEEHKYLLNSYQHIAQRAREVFWFEKPDKEVEELLKDLERDFALLKARGSEPLDKHYDAAHKIISKVKADKDAKVAQSFSFTEETK